MFVLAMGPVPAGSLSPWEVGGKWGPGEGPLLCEPQILPVSLDTPAFSPPLAAEVFTFPTRGWWRSLGITWIATGVQKGKSTGGPSPQIPTLCMIVTDFGEWTQIKTTATILQNVRHRVFPQGLCSLSFIIALRGQNCGHGGRKKIGGGSKCWLLWVI